MSKDMSQYEHQPDDSWKCKKCGSDIMAARVAHPIWLTDGPGPCAGTGEVEYEEIPYCPKCEQPPNFHGSPKMKSIAETILDDLI